MIIETESKWAIASDSREDKFNVKVLSITFFSYFVDGKGQGGIDWIEMKLRMGTW